MVIQDSIFDGNCGGGVVSAVGLDNSNGGDPAAILDNCIFKPKLAALMGPSCKALENADDDVHRRGGRSVWYDGAFTTDFRVRGNDFAGGFLFWQLLQGTARLECNIFHGPNVAGIDRIEVHGAHR